MLDVSPPRQTTQTTPHTKIPGMRKASAFGQDITDSQRSFHLKGESSEDRSYVFPGPLTSLKNERLYIAGYFDDTRIVGPDACTSDLRLIPPWGERGRKGGGGVVPTSLLGVTSIWGLATATVN
jgi:hypothetical protein